MAILVIIGILQLATIVIMLNRIEASVDDCYIALEEQKDILNNCLQKLKSIETMKLIESTGYGTDDAQKALEATENASTVAVEIEKRLDRFNKNYMAPS